MNQENVLKDASPFLNIGFDWIVNINLKYKYKNKYILLNYIEILERL